MGLGVGRHKHLYSQASEGVEFFDKHRLVFGRRWKLYHVGIEEDTETEMMARSVPIGVLKRTPILEPT